MHRSLVALPPDDRCNHHNWFAVPSLGVVWESQPALVSVSLQAPKVAIFPWVSLVRKLFACFLVRDYCGEIHVPVRCWILVYFF